MNKSVQSPHITFEERPSSNQNNIKPSNLAGSPNIQQSNEKEQDEKATNISKRQSEANCDEAPMKNGSIYSVKEDNINNRSSITKDKEDRSFYKDEYEQRSTIKLDEHFDTKNEKNQQNNSKHSENNNTSMKDNENYDNGSFENL